LWMGLVLAAVLTVYVGGRGEESLGPGPSRRSRRAVRGAAGARSSTAMSRFIPAPVPKGEP
jgi:hypothetical protein